MSAKAQEKWISKVIREKAPVILDEIKKASSILLHCHPSPDPDSVGSALAMVFALKKLGKEATIIRGDSEISGDFKLLPVIDQIVDKNFFEINLSSFDLFIILDSGGLRMVSAKGEVVFPEGLNTIVIDHHISNKGYGKINLIDASSPATAFILYQLFSEWKIDLNREIALNLFTGM